MSLGSLRATNNNIHKVLTSHANLCYKSLILWLLSSTEARSDNQMRVYRLLVSKQRNKKNSSTEESIAWLSMLYPQFYDFFLCFFLHKNQIWDLAEPQQPVTTIRQPSATIMKKCRSMPAVLIQNTFDSMKTNAEDTKMLIQEDSSSSRINVYTVSTETISWSRIHAKMQLNIPSPYESFINYQLTLNLVDICLDNTLQILCIINFCYA